MPVCQLSRHRLTSSQAEEFERQKLYWEQQQEQWRQEQLSAMNEQWNAHVGNWEAGMESRQQQLDRVWKEQLEQHKDATWNEMNGHMRATLAAREEELVSGGPVLLLKKSGADSSFRRLNASARERRSNGRQPEYR